METFLQQNYEDDHEDLAHSSLKNKVIKHDEFLKRIRNSLYYGNSPSAPAPSKPCQISRPLAEFAADYFSDAHKGYSLNRLSFVTVGNLKNTTPCSLILSMIYLERLNKIDPLYSKKITPTELFLVSMMVSTKFYSGYDEDIFVSSWTDFGKISIERMKELELDFLNAIQWNIYVSSDQFLKKLKTVETWLAKNQSMTRGWCTYSELAALIPSISIAKQIINYTTILLFSYTCSLITLCGAFLLASKVPHTHLYNKFNFAVSSTNFVPVFNDPTISKSPQNVLLDGNGDESLEECPDNRVETQIVSFFSNYSKQLLNHHSTKSKILKIKELAKNWKKYSNDFMGEVPNSTSYKDILMQTNRYDNFKFLVVSQ